MKKERKKEKKFEVVFGKKKEEFFEDDLEKKSIPRTTPSGRKVRRYRERK